MELKKEEVGNAFVLRVHFGGKDYPLVGVVRQLPREKGFHVFISGVCDMTIARISIGEWQIQRGSKTIIIPKLVQAIGRKVERMFYPTSGKV